MAKGSRSGSGARSGVSSRSGSKSSGSSSGSGYSWNHYASYASVPATPMVYAPVNPVTGSVGKPGATCNGAQRTEAHTRSRNGQPASFAPLGGIVYNSAHPRAGNTCVTASVLASGERAAIAANPGYNKTAGGNGLRNCHCG